MFDILISMIKKEPDDEDLFPVLTERGHALMKPIQRCEWRKDFRGAYVILSDYIKKKK